MELKKIITMYLHRDGLNIVYPKNPSPEDQFTIYLGPDIGNMEKEDDISSNSPLHSRSIKPNHGF